MALSAPVITGHFSDILEDPYLPLDLADPHLKEKAQAIVVLGGGLDINVPEYAGGNTVSALTLGRLRYAADLYRITRLPILVSGGKARDDLPAESTLMKETLEREFSVPVRWAEDRSINTRQNARYSVQILEQAGIQRIFLVTNAWHMERARGQFMKAGFKNVVPAAMGFTDSGEPLIFRDWLPDAKSLVMSDRLIHEVLGLIWYRVTGP